VLLAYAAVLALSVPPYVVAGLWPPPERAFIGTFWFGDDFYNYLSYAVQAEEGAFLFQNRVLLEPHPPALVNPEWWIVGRLSALLGGGQLLLAYRMVAALAAALFLVVLDLWLRKLAIPASHRLPALLLVSLGGGLGALLAPFGFEGLDLYAGLFPFLGLLTNPHFVIGTTLLLLGLLLLEDGRPAAVGLGIAVATLLALVRPYDLVILVSVRAAVVVALEPRARWVRSLLPLAGLLPVVGYLYWLFYANPSFSFYARTPYALPPLQRFALALGPAALLAGLGAWRTEPDPGPRRARAHLLAWACVGLVVVLTWPVPYALQFLVSLGLPLLALGAYGLRRRPAAVTAGAAALLSTSCWSVAHTLYAPDPRWFAPRPDLALARALRPICREGDVFFGPPSAGVFVYGLTACRAFVSHPIDPGYQAKMAELQRFSGLAPDQRAALLDRYAVTHFASPGEGQDRPVAWLGEATRFRLRFSVPGRPGWSLYTRGGP
jgi:hypothetical protein